MAQLYHIYMVFYNIFLSLFPLLHFFYILYIIILFDIICKSLIRIMAHSFYIYYKCVIISLQYAMVFYWLVVLVVFVVVVDSLYYAQIAPITPIRSMSKERKG